MGFFTRKTLLERHGIPARLIRALVLERVVVPKQSTGRTELFNLEDVLLLRMALELKSSGLGSPAIAKVIRQAKEQLPKDLPTTGLRVAFENGHVTIRQGSERRLASGQLLLELDVGLVERSAIPIRHPSVGGQPTVQKEEADSSEVSLETWLEVVAAALERGDLARAYALAREAAEEHPEEALLHYNLGVTLEACDHEGEALIAYQEAIRLDPQLADAHFNAARLFELRGDQRAALRHYSAYRRHARTI